MSEKNCLLILVLVTSITGLIIIYAMIRAYNNSVDQQTIDVCTYYAPIRKAEYAGTPYANLDFYKFCIDNIKCISPANLPADCR